MIPMRILHVVARSHRRGAEMVAMELTYELDQLGHENRVLALGLAHDGGRDAALPPLVSRRTVGVDVLVLDAVRLRRHLRDNPVDVVLAHGGWAVQVVALAIPRGGPSVVWQRILGFPDNVWGPPRLWWWRMVTHRIDAAVALTEPLERELRRLRFAGPVWVIPNARRPERFAVLDREEEQLRLRAEVGAGPDAALLGFVGHLVPQKRPERAIEVVARLVERGRVAHLVMAGDGPLRGEVQREITSRGLRGHVTMLGHRNDIEHVLGGVDLLLLTSDREGIPGVAIEAQMAGCPVVSFPTGGVGEVVDDGVTGVVLRSHDPAAMADTVEALLSDEPRRQAMSEEARSRSGEFATSHIAQIYADRLASLRSDQ